MENLKEIEGLRNGDYKTFESMFTTWYKPLYLYAYSIIRDQENAEDIVQKMFCKLWDQSPKIEIHTSLKSYLYRIVHNDCLNWIKRRDTLAEHHQYLSYAGEKSTNSTESQLMLRDLEKQVETAIESLPPRCREVFKLSRFEHLSYLEISQKLNITPNTVETQIVKALRLLRTALKDFLMVLVWLLVDK
ncbi:MAG: RNA polymerase sigma-70 factor [Bacteroidales bacterium]|nr:RNA polymerase sigma-70 factor [Bacteroidales bacterium]